ncbi:MAG: DUF4838 domain-containing protein, partial [Bradymonadales bacterium]|nr:DUF4838 domain-containing protein [Bradymonadales bacterium]
MQPTDAGLERENGSSPRSSTLLPLALGLSWFLAGLGSSWALVGCDRDAPVEDASGDPQDVAEELPDTRDDGDQDDLRADPDLDGEPDEQVDPIDPDSLWLVEDGESAYTIVLQAGASPSERWAAEELRDGIQACTGAILPIVEEPPPEDTPQIILGMGPLAAALGVEPSAVELGAQGCALRTVPPHLVIAGTPQGGTLNGVHRFLQDALGIRWLTPDTTITPSQADVVVPPLDRIVRPAFSWRHTSYEWPGADEAFLSRAGDNEGGGDADNRYGEQEQHYGRAHSYFSFIHPNEFFDSHPEYFSEIGGVRIREETQLCLTNPDVLEIVTERMLERIAAHPQYRQYNFSQQDHYNGCQCDRCRAVNEQYGTDGGTQFWFVNQLAERVAEVYPDKLVGTLAYMYTEEPPVGTEMHPNAVVWLCHMYPSCDSHSIEACELNADFERRARAWAGLTSHLYIWHYIVNFTHYYEPFPNLGALAENLRFYRDLGVEGIYLQGMGHEGGGGELSLLRPYYGMQLLWDPDQDPDAILDEFLVGYYGRATPAIREYIDMLQDEVDDNHIHMHLYTNPAQGYLSDEVLARANDLFDEAEDAVSGDQVLTDRVQVARMPLVYARMFPRNGYLIEGNRLVWQGEMATFADYTWFREMMEDHGFQVMREVAGGIDTLMLLFAVLGMDPVVEEIHNDFLRVEVVPLLAGRALRIIDLASGQSVTASNVTTNLFFPFCGGLEDRAGEQFDSFGWVEPARVVSLGETSIQIMLTTMNGFLLERTLTLSPDEPLL